MNEACNLRVGPGVETSPVDYALHLRRRVNIYQIINICTRHAFIELTIRIHVTCDNNFTTGDNNTEANCCACDKSLGPCCCISVDADTDDDEITSIDEKGTKISAKPKVTSASSITSGTRSSVLPCAIFQSGRPDFHPLLGELLVKAEGETGIAVCGPLGLSSNVRTTVAKCSNDRAVHKGTGAQGIFLHAEGFGW